jgi:hypothetical protein
MRASLFFVVLGAVIPAGACHRNPAETPQTLAKKIGQSVFTDSALHAQRCEPIKPGENWRAVCVPRDQGVDFARPKKP